MVIKLKNYPHVSMFILGLDLTEIKDFFSAQKRQFHPFCTIDFNSTAP